MSTKDTNPKDAVGVAKVPISALPCRVLGLVGLALMEGGRKYGRHNWREAGVRASVYYDATARHLMAWWEGEDVDPDSGLSHVIKAIASLVVLADSMLEENWTDDRPPAVKPGWVQEMNAHAAELIRRHPEALPPYTQKRREEDAWECDCGDPTCGRPDPDEERVRRERGEMAAAVEATPTRPAPLSPWPSRSRVTEDDGL